MKMSPQTTHEMALWCSKCEKHQLHRIHLLPDGFGNLISSACICMVCGASQPGGFRPNE
jgi:hypothetical protein